MTSISLDQATTIVNAALAKAGSEGFAALTVAVLDAGGHLVALARQDGSSNLRPQLAIGKASTALALGMASRKIGEMAAERPSFVAALGSLAPDGIIPAAGGMLILNGGEKVGAVGITGDTSDNDEACAIAGIEAAGLTAG